MTLVELLVVIVIMSILVAAVLPGIQPALEDRKIREASRQVNAYFAKARARAAEIDRPVAVVFERVAAGRNDSYQIFLAESPQMYTGDTLGATAAVSTVAGWSGAAWQTKVSFAPNTLITVAKQPGESIVCKPGDLIRFDYRGRWYQVDSVHNPTATDIIIKSSELPPEPPPVIQASPATRSMRFQIQRQPEKSGETPLQLPTGTVVDLGLSGFGSSGTEFNVGGDIPVVITFEADGTVSQVSYGDGAGNVLRGTPLAPIYFMIGRQDKVGAAQPADSNLADLNNLWVAVNPQTGLVTTSDNGFDPSGAQTLAESREFARKAEAVGGR